MKLLAVGLLLCVSASLIAQHNIKPKPSVVISGSVQIHSDSVVLASCAEFALRPFGSIHNPKALKNSPLSQFSIVTFKKRQENGVYTFHHLTFRSSYLYLYFDNDPESSPGGEYIFNGVIRDSSVHFLNGIRVGMSLDSFIKIFFDDFDQSLYKPRMFFAIEYCVSSLRQTYSFNDGTLTSIKFEPIDTFWKVP